MEAVTIYIYPDNLTAKATLWLWELRDLAAKDLESLRVLPVSSVVNLFPFNYSGKTDPQGLYVGRDKNGSNIIVYLDRRAGDKAIASILILGNSGQGKPYLLKLLLCNLLESGKSVICLDPEHELGELCKNLGGCFVDLMGGQYRFVRYADDWLAGACGTKEECEILKAEVSQFLSAELKLRSTRKRLLLRTIQKKFDSWNIFFGRSPPGYAFERKRFKKNFSAKLRFAVSPCESNRAAPNVPWSGPAAYKGNRRKTAFCAQSFLFDPFSFSKEKE